MTNDEFINLVERMRKAQKGFFKSNFGSAKRSDYLAESKQLEKQVDNFIKKHKDPQQNLFNENND
jgi:hypothetical protein